MQKPRKPFTVRWSVRIAPRQCKPPGLPVRLLFGLALLGSAPRLSLAADDPPKGLPPRVERLLRWLPEDTETLIVARSVTLPAPDPDGAYTWQDFGAGFAIQDLDLVGDGKLSKPLQGRKMDCVIHGAKNFESVSSFGSLRSESCAIIVFEADLGDAAREWTEGLRKGAKAVRTLVGREVFVFPSTTEMEPWVKETTWQGTYFVLLNTNTLLCASSDRYLESVLRRIDDVPGTRALPDDLPEWKQVDFDAPVWMLRHLPQVGRRIHTVGATAAFLRDGFRVVYVPKMGSDQDLESIKGHWEECLPKQGLDDQELRDRLRIERRSDGTVVVSCGGKLDPEEALAENFGFSLRLYWLQGQALVEPSDRVPQQAALMWPAGLHADMYKIHDGLETSLTPHPARAGMNSFGRIR